jgi:hypothetical protein
MIANTTFNFLQEKHVADMMAELPSLVNDSGFAGSSPHPSAGRDSDEDTSPSTSLPGHRHLPSHAVIPTFIWDLSLKEFTGYRGECRNEYFSMSVYNFILNTRRFINVSHIP